MEDMNQNQIKDESLEIKQKEKPFLILKELEGTSLNNEQIKIYPFGIINSMRKAQDNSVKFGSRIQDENGKVVNDYALANISNQSISELFSLFQIRFNKENAQYYLIPENYIDDNYSVFVKIEKKMMIRSKCIISLGDIHFSIEVENSNLKLEMVLQNEETKTKVFVKENKVVRIGRNKDNEIYLNNLAFSRVHTSLIYDEIEQAWGLQDGFDNKTSTNGTWIYLDFPWEINQNASFRFGNSLFLINLFDN